MARQLTTKLTGTKQGLSFYKMYDTFYVRTKSEGGKQTQRTKARQKDFAIAASLSASIRKALHFAIPNPKQRTMQNRLTAALMKWVLTEPFNQTGIPKEITQLKGFSFTEDATIQEIFNAVIIQTDVANNTVRVTTPSFIPKRTIDTPAGTKQLQLTIAAANLSINKKFIKETAHHQFTIPYTRKQVKQQTITFNCQLQPNTISVVALAISYFIKQDNEEELRMIKQHKWQPAAIVFAQLN